MMILVLSLLFPGLLQAEANLEQHLVKIASHEVAKVCETCQVELELTNEKVTEDIAIPDSVVADRWKGQTNLVLTLGKEKRIVTANIRWIDKVVIAKENIRQGQIITNKALRVVDKDVTYIKAAYVNDPKAIVGQIGKRVFKRGHIIDESYLKKPLAVRYGQPLKLEIQEGSLTLTIDAKAKGAGAIGDQIPVFIPKTRKRIMAEIIEKGRVKL